jgi:hypothetical protein
VSAIAFLLIAIAISVVGSIVLVARYRNPTSTEHAVTEFQREMRALAPRPGEHHDHDPHPDHDRQQPH